MTAKIIRPDFRPKPRPMPTLAPNSLSYCAAVLTAYALLYREWAAACEDGARALRGSGDCRPCDSEPPDGIA